MEAFIAIALPLGIVVIALVNLIRANREDQELAKWNNANYLKNSRF